MLLGLDKAGSDLDAVSKFLDTAGSKLDYRRYGEALFDILIAGGLLGKKIMSFNIYSHPDNRMLDFFHTKSFLLSITARRNNYHTV